MPRKHERVTFFTEVSLEFASGRREARISDLSEGGCFVESIAAVRPGERVRLTIMMLDGAEVPAAGEITYTFDGMGFGLSFTDLSDDSHRRIAEFVSARTALEGSDTDRNRYNPQLDGYLDLDGERPGF
jgi:hypothetical protein